MLLCQFQLCVNLITCGSGAEHKIPGANQGFIRRKNLRKLFLCIK